MKEINLFIRSKSGRVMLFVLVGIVGVNLWNRAVTPAWAFLLIGFQVGVLVLGWYFINKRR